MMTPVVPSPHSSSYSTLGVFNMNLGPSATVLFHNAITFISSPEERKRKKHTFAGDLTFQPEMLWCGVCKESGQHYRKEVKRYALMTNTGVCPPDCRAKENKTGTTLQILIALVVESNEDVKSQKQSPLMNHFPTTESLLFTLEPSTRRGSDGTYGDEQTNLLHSCRRTRTALYPRVCIDLGFIIFHSLHYTDL
jgi:hypothetical protein